MRGENAEVHRCVRSTRELCHGDEAIGRTELRALIVRTTVMDPAEAVAHEQHVELFALPTTHDELIVADALLASPHHFVALRYQQRERRIAPPEVVAAAGYDRFDETDAAVQRLQRASMVDDARVEQVLAAVEGIWS